MRKVIFAAFLLAGCEFGIEGLPITGPDLSMELPDAGGGDGALPPDLSPAGDLAMRVPDGATQGGIGWPCGKAADCMNGLCVDGYCCDDLCDPMVMGNGCKACNVPGAEGRCVLALDGTDPRGACPQDPAATCGRDGLCDGRGNCRLYASGTQCAPPSCSGGTVTYAAACDGTGNCAQPTAATCFPYDCADATSCATTCSGSTGCATGVTCTMGSCGQKSDGQPCVQPSECSSGNCEQGVCCASDCSASCFACNLPGSVGTCSPVPNGMDPLNQCAAQTRASCGTDGQCDGSGNCRMWPAGTVCQQAMCMGNSVVAAEQCDGNGSCQPSNPQSCGNYGCDSSTVTCFTSCMGPMQCAPGHMCKKGACK